MKLIVGLGNPGEKYASTRHNFGFLAVDQFVKDCTTATDNWTNNPKLKSEIVTLAFTPKGGEEERVIVAKPQTFMNNSGLAVKLLMDFYKVEPEDVLVIYDELDLPLGHIKIRVGGSGAGHHGIESIMEHIGTDKFWRYRLGIGTSHDKEHAIGSQHIRDAKEYVLGTFKSGEQGKARELIKHGAKSLEMSLEKGIEAAMNRFNTK